MRFRHGERLISRSIEPFPWSIASEDVASRFSLTRACLCKRVPTRKARCLLAETRAQATVEAAMLLPAFLTLLLLVLQPVCVLYTRSVMESAASETARIMVTTTSEADSCEAFAMRRLAAVPNLSIFHAGGPLSWEVELNGASGESDEVSVAITGAVTPLPVLGAFVGALGATNAQGDVEMRVEVSYPGQPAWLEGSYEAWIERWG